MSQSTPTWTTTLSGILVHPVEPRVLMQPGKDGWSLPSAMVAEDVWRADMRKVNAALGQVLTAPFTTLRYAQYETDGETQRNEAVYVLESQSSAWQPQEGAAWIAQADLEGLALAQPRRRDLIAGVLAEVASGRVPELRPLWARAGWYAEAAAWTGSELARLGYTLTAPVEQVKSWGISCILRAQTARGIVYFKVASSLPLFAHEPRLMRSLAEMYPAHVPAPLSIDEDRRWMLLDDFGPAVGWDAPVDAQEAMLVAYGMLQRDAVDHIDELWRMGCLDRSLERLAAQIDPLLADTAMLAVQSNSAEIERLRALAPRLKALCAELAGYAVPHTLVHGDLHLGNVARRGHDYLFFDWTDACVAHPFFDTISIFQNDDPTVETRLRDSYLRIWADYASLDKLYEAWTLAKPLAALHQAVSYRHIIATMEEVRKPENRSGLPYWLRKLLHWLE